MIGSFAEVTAACRNTSTFSSHLMSQILSNCNGALGYLICPRFGLGPIDVLAIEDDPKHAIHRKAVQKILTAKAVKVTETYDLLSRTTHLASPC